MSIYFATSANAEKLNCPCQVTNVIDGETVFVLDQFRSSRKIWLAGIDAPGMDKHFGEHSRSNLNDLVAGHKIEVEYIKRDRYGRIIGKLLKDGLDINLQQIKDGYALHYQKGTDEQSEEDRSIYINAEAQAKQKKAGLWTLTNGFTRNK